MPAPLSTDLQRVIEGRDPSQVDVLIEALPGQGSTTRDFLRDEGVQFSEAKVGNRTVFEATVSTDRLDALQQQESIALIDHSPTFSALGAALPIQPGFDATQISESVSRRSLYETTQQMGVEEAWAEIGSRGEGAKVGVVDTPADDQHEALQSSIVETGGGGSPEDHGTWVAGAIVADDTVTDRGRVRGVAPEADLYHYGALSGGKASAVSILNGVNFCLENDCDIINLSLGGPHSDVLQRAVIEATNQGALMVTSAGNSGPAENTVTCPAHHKESLAVGSEELTGDVAAFSSRGTDFSDGGQKPEVMCYGGGADVGDVNLEITEVVLGPAAGNSYRYLMGTSMASPQVAGVAALRAAAEKDN